VMICGSFSKTVAPGIRLGWVDAGRWSAPLRRMKAVHSGSQTELLQLAMADILTQPGHESGYRQLRATIAARVDEARGLIAESFPRGTKVTDPAGGFILWVELPGGLDSIALFRACLAEKICFAPGTMFSATDRYRHCLRLGVGGRWDDAQRAGLRRIGELARAMLGVAASPAPAPAAVAVAG
jgi:DNA-binding transcriptional MocR family regulator